MSHGFDLLYFRLPLSVSNIYLVQISLCYVTTKQSIACRQDARCIKSLLAKKCNTFSLFQLYYTVCSVDKLDDKLLMHFDPAAQRQVGENIRQRAVLMAHSIGIRGETLVSIEN